MIALNVETIDDEFENNEVRRSGKSFSRDYEILTIEVCFLGNCLLFCTQIESWWNSLPEHLRKLILSYFLAMRDYALFILSNGQWTDFAYGGTQGTLGAYEGCVDIFYLLFSAIIYPALLNSAGMYLFIR